MFKTVAVPPQRVLICGASKTAAYLAQRYAQIGPNLEIVVFSINVPATSGTRIIELHDGRSTTDTPVRNPLPSKLTEPFRTKVKTPPNSKMGEEFATADIIHVRAPMNNIGSYLPIINLLAKPGATVIFPNAQDPAFLKSLRSDLKPVCLEIFEALVATTPEGKTVLCAEKSVVRVYTKTPEEFADILPHLAQILPGQIIPIIGDLIPCLVNGGNASYHPEILIFGHILESIFNLENLSKIAKKDLLQHMQGLPNLFKHASSLKEILRVDPKKRFYVDAPKWMPEILLEIGREFEQIGQHIQRLYGEKELHVEGQYRRLSKLLTDIPERILESLHPDARKALEAPQTYTEWLNHWSNTYSSTYMASRYGHITGTHLLTEAPKTSETLSSEFQKWLNEKIYAHVLVPTKDGRILTEHRFISEDFGVLLRLAITATQLGMDIETTPYLKLLFRCYEGLKGVTLYRENEHNPSRRWTEEALNIAFHTTELPSIQELQKLFIHTTPAQRFELAKL